MPDTGAPSSALERFLRYVTYDTTSDPSSAEVPSTAKQLVLLDLLVEELQALGLADAARDEHGIVMATLPATAGREGAPVVGFIAHVDTSPEMSGTDVWPIVHRDWDGSDILLPDDPAVVLSASTDPELAGRVGDDIVTASGLTLLGADDKTGVAVVMAALQHLAEHPEIGHGPLRVAFTPDEEIGTGVRHFDVARFGAYCAYTLDSHGAGRLEAETFSADALTVTFRGRNTHPGFAYGRMVNAVKVASDFVSRLPRDLTPEATRETEGFVHPHGMRASVDVTSVEFILRDFETAALDEQEALLRRLAEETVRDWPGSEVTLERSATYRNMRDHLAGHPRVLDLAREAIRRVTGREAEEGRIRGGTDGSQLCTMGLPTPNLSSGQHAFHSRQEWASVEEMEIAVRTVIALAELWAQEASAT